MSDFSILSPVSGGAPSDAPTVFHASTVDDIATITAAGYLDDLADAEGGFKVKNGDVLFLQYGEGTEDAAFGVANAATSGDNLNLVMGLPGGAGGLNYLGTWNATTNTPTLPSSPAADTNGDFYIVSVAGTQFSISWGVGDWIISNGSAWQKIDNSDLVTSVFGRTGAVVAVTGDYFASEVVNQPAGGISATSVQGAINELDSEKVSVTLPSGDILVGNVSNVATAVAVSGDITLSNAGVAAIAAGVIVNADVNASAGIDQSKLKALTVSRAAVTDGSGFLTQSTTTAAEIAFVNGVTSAIQTQLNAKISSGTGAIVNADVNAAAAIALSKLAATTASRALVSDGSGFVSAATTTATELGYVNGVTSAIQTQLNAKLSSTSLLVPYLVSKPTGAGGAAAQSYTIAGMVSTDVVSVAIQAQANVSPILTIVPGAGSLVITFVGDPGATTINLAAWHTV